MKYQNILNLLNETSDSKFVSRKCNIVNDQSNVNDDVRIEIIYNTEVLKSILYDYNDAYDFGRGDITVIADPATQVSFTSCAPFAKDITKFEKTIIDDAENLDLVIPMYNLLYSRIYSYIVSII